MNIKRCVTATTLSLAIFSGSSVIAAEFGSAEEAKAMLEYAVGEIKSDKETTLQSINAGTDGFKDRDLYVFCAGPVPGEGKVIAHGANSKLIGLQVSAFVDKAGKAFGQAMLDTAVAGQILEMDYLWPRPNEEEPVEKVSFITLVSDLLCGVGYYK